MSKYTRKLNDLIKSLFKGTFKFEYHKLIREKEIDKYIPIIEKEYETQINSFAKLKSEKTNYEKNIFMYWHSGLNKINFIAKQCIENIQAIFTNYGYKVFVLDFESVKNDTFFNFDKKFIELYQKKKISVQSLSDAIRFTALHELGGVWLDASVFLNQYINFEEVLSSLSFNTIGLDYKYRDFDNISFNWALFALVAKKHNIVSKFILDISLDFYLKHKTYPYMLSDILIYICKKYNIDGINCYEFGKIKSNFAFVLNSDQFNLLSDESLNEYIKKNPQKLNFGMLKENKSIKKIQRLFKVCKI